MLTGDGATVWLPSRDVQTWKEKKNETVVVPVDNKTNNSPMRALADMTLEKAPIAPLLLTAPDVSPKTRT